MQYFRRNAPFSYYYRATPSLLPAKFAWETGENLKEERRKYRSQLYLYNLSNNLSILVT